MKKIYLALLMSCLALAGRSQSAANYSFATTITGSLTDMSTGTTQLIAADQDDIASAITNIGFDLYFQGVRYTQFSVNSNGTLRLGGTSVSNTLYDPLGQAGLALITSFGADQRTHAGDGKVHYKVTGTAPNRILIVEWLNMQTYYSTGGTADATYQLRLYETTGAAESVYGSMTMSTQGAADANTNSPQYGFSSGNTTNTVGTVTAAQSGSPAPSYSSAAAPVNNLYTAGAITVLTSVANGSRRTFSYTPPTPLAPTGLTFTSVAASITTLNWTDNATNELGYIIYQSTDGITYNFLTQVAANSTSAALTGLTGSTLYYYRIYAVTEGGLSSALSGSQATPAPTANLSNGTGLWSAPATWSAGSVPTINDAVTIRNGDVVTIDVASVAYSLTVGQGTSGTLQFEQTTARTLTVGTDATIAAGGVFQSNPAGTQTGHTLALNGNLVNNGTLDFSTATDLAGAGITFGGTANTSFAGAGATTDVRLITINKSATTAILEMNVSAFTVRGTTTDVITGGFLTMTNGIYKISGTNTYTGRMFSAAAYTIPATAGVWLNNPNFTVAGQAGNGVNNGAMRVSNGTWNVGSAINNTLTGAAGAAFIIDGGTLNVAGRFIPATAVSYTQSAGTLNVATVGNSGTGVAGASFSLPSTATFSFTGGSINLVQACTGATPVDYINSAAITVFGGTLRAGTTATATNFNFRVRGNLPNFVIDNTTNSKTATAGAQLNLNGSTTISTGATFVINGFVCLVIGSPFTNNGTLTGTAASTRFYFLGGNGPATYTGTGVVTAPLTSFEVDNPAGVTIDPATTNQIVLTRFNNFSGGLTNSNKLTIGNGGATAPIIQLGVAGGTQTVGGFDVAPTFNAGTGGLSLLYAPELTGRTTGPEVPPSRNIAILNIINTNTITIAGGDITTSTLIMAGGNIATGSNTLVLGTSAAAPGTYTYTSGTIVGIFKRWISVVTGNNDFPVGITTARRNASINFTTAPATGGTLTAQWISANPGDNGLPLTEGSIVVNGASADGYWSVVAADGLTGGAYTGTFTATGVSGITDVTKLVLLKRSSTAGSPWTLDGTHVTGSGTTAVPVLSRTGMVGFSEFGIGNNTVPLPLHLLSFTGRKAGAVNRLDWNTADEHNTLGFEVQRSLNGADYETLGFANARPGGQVNSYSFTDNAPTGAVQYYRLKMVDQGNSSTFSNIVTIRGAKADGLAITAMYPNPAASALNLLLTSPSDDVLSVTITDLTGKLVAQQQLTVVAGSNIALLNVSLLPAGSYLLKASGRSNGEVCVGRFVKQ